jgi:hypothetical protein
MVMRSFTTVRLRVQLRSKKAAEMLKEMTMKKYGHLLRLRRRENVLIVEGDGVQDYRIRDWILDRAGA